MLAITSLQGITNVRQEHANALSTLALKRNATTEESALDDMHSVATSAKAKRAVLRKRNRIGKTPAEKINWTPAEVSRICYF